LWKNYKNCGHPQLDLNDHISYMTKIRFLTNLQNILLNSMGVSALPLTLACDPGGVPVVAAQ
jgi:hypothetical protein